MSGSGTQSASFSSPVDFRISQHPPTVRNFNEVELAFAELYAFANQVIRAFTDNCGIGPQVPAMQQTLAGDSRTLLSGNLRRLYVKASEPIVFGGIINLWNNAGLLEVRNANATNNTRVADGFCSAPLGLSTGEIGEVTVGCGIARIGGLVVGQRYWLSTTNGVIANIPSTAAGNVEQLLGIGIDATHFFYSAPSFWLQH